MPSNSRTANHASATCIGVATRRAATPDNAEDCSLLNPPSGKNRTYAIPSRAKSVDDVHLRTSPPQQAHLVIRMCRPHATSAKNPRQPPAAVSLHPQVSPSIIP